MRAFLLAVTGLAFSIAGCSSYGTSVVAVEKTRAQVASVSVAIPPSLVAGQRARAVATPRDASGSPLTDRSVTWSTSSASVASVTDSGMVSAVAPGTAVVSAVSEGVAGQASMAVVPPAPAPVASVTVSPTAATLQVGATQQLSAVTLDANNNVLTGRAVSWTSTNTGIATVSASGLVTAVAAGNVSVRATSEGQIGSAAITVTAAAPVPVASVTVSPSSASLQVGGTQQLSAVTRDANNNVLTGRAVSWTSTNTGIATVSGSGLVTAVAAGNVSVRATSEGQIGSAAITITAPAPIPVASVTVSPSSASLQVGGTQQLSVVTRDANNNVLTGRVVTWSSANTAVASVSSNGVVTAVSAGGPVQITATSETKTATSAITVTAATPVPVATVTVTPSSASLQVGGTQQLSAVTRDANNNVLTGRVVTWSSANTAVASVNSNGVVSAVSAGGPVQITATSETKTATSAITVTAAPPPPPPGGGAGWRGKEPAGLTPITDQGFTSLPSNGWTGWFNYDLTSDATGPQSPGSAFENLYPAGMAGGINPGLAEYEFSNRKTLYISMYVKHSANFQGHSSTVNKIIHIWIGSLNHLFLNAAGTGNGSLVGQIRLQGIAGGGNFDGGTAGIYDNGVNMARDQWHLLEVIAVANTGSNKDGSVSLYVDGVLAGSCSGIEFEGGGPSWNLVKIDPTWGGTGDRVTSAMSIRVDHIYISGN